MREFRWSYLITMLLGLVARRLLGVVPQSAGKTAYLHRPGQQRARVVEQPAHRGPGGGLRVRQRVRGGVLLRGSRRPPALPQTVNRHLASHGEHFLDRA